MVKEEWIEFDVRSVSWFKRGVFLKIYLSGVEDPLSIKKDFAKYEGGRWYFTPIVITSLQSATARSQSSVTQ